MILTGRNYEAIRDKMVFDLHLVPGMDYKTETMQEGFLNDKDTFLNKVDAKFEARSCNQLTIDTEDRELYPEDIKSL